MRPPPRVGFSRIQANEKMLARCFGLAPTGVRQILLAVALGLFGAS